ncbi:family 78 glycoside hydrolase catalytic domain [Paenibacillus psychroresistens]|nr:family 78 glycoside hydrolase catalytic domain [Paenibacillus psychroresistens]
MNSLNEALWIWNRENQSLVNQYVDFRHEFDLIEAASHASLLLSVDSDYAVWLNGQFVEYGQYDDYPQNKAYDYLTVGHLLHAGTNVLTILAYYQGESTFQYRKGNPGLIYSLDTGESIICSGSDTFCRQSLSYVNGLTTHISVQLGYTFEYKAASDDQWRALNYRMSGVWEAADTNLLLNKIWPSLYERPLKKLILKERIQASLKSQGVFIRNAEPIETAAKLIQSDFLSFRMPENILVDTSEINLEALTSHSKLSLAASWFKEVTGIYLVYDLGQEESGLFELEVDAEHGAIIDIGYGEHLDDLRVRASVGERNFAFTYHCGQGPQTFTHYFKRIAGRYIQLHIHGVQERFVLHYAGMRPVEYPIELRGEFDCPDLLHMRIAQTAVRTLHLCMHEHYEDTPWREQALYALDSRNQALCGYYCFGEYDFPQESFKLLGESLRDDGFLEICAPAECEITIPSFSFMWVVELAEFMLYSGRLEYIATVLPIVQRMMNVHISNMQDDLLRTPVEKGYWNFYDWENGLEGYAEINECRWDAPLNLVFVMALEAAGAMLNSCGLSEESIRYTAIAERVKLAVHERFWVSTEGAYLTYQEAERADHYAELTQALALLAAIPPNDEIADQVRAGLAVKENGYVPITLSHSIFKFKALLGEPARYQNLVFESIGETWGSMLFNGATSFWETKDGSAAFSNAGSLCHGWSAIPLFFYYAYLLGVQPIEPGFKTFKVVPTPAGFHKISGVVPTPYGPIEVNWQQTPAGLELRVTHPDEISRVI